MLKHFSKIMLICTALSLWGCYPQGAEFVDELDLVATVRPKDVNYNDYSTYVIADTIIFLSNVGDSKLDDTQEAFIIDEVDKRFEENGWTKSTDPDNDGSDVLILISVLEDVNVSIINEWWGYWDFWGGWGYYPGYPGGGYYPGYPGICCYSSVYSYTTGSLIIEMVDPNNAEISEDVGTIPLLWTGAINGLLEGSKSNINSRIKTALDRMFEDSPYLFKI